MSAFGKFWWRDSLCTQVGWHTFFTGESRQEAAEAIKVCSLCPVLEACKASLLREEGGRPYDQMHGVRAGLTKHQRYLMFHKLCPGCGAQRDQPTSRLCSACHDAAGQSLDPVMRRAN